MSLSNLQVVTDAGIEASEWRSRIGPGGTGEPIEIAVAARPVRAIVLTQDCDAIRSESVTLAEILDFRNVERSLKDALPGSEAWVARVTQGAKVNQKWFYLPQEATLGFPVPMGVDFRVVFSLQRLDLESYRDFRIGKLNGDALSHFRERVSEFFRRYAYDEWYPLTKAEFERYRKRHPDAEPFPWQK